MSRYKGIRFFAYFLEILVLFMVQETPGLMPSVYGVRPTLLIPAALLIGAAFFFTGSFFLSRVVLPVMR